MVLVLNKEDFYRLVDKNTKIQIKGIDVELVPDMADIILLAPTKDSKMNNEDKKKGYREIFKRSIVKGTFPEVTDEELDQFIAQNFADISMGLAKAYGFVTQDEIDNLKKKVAEQKEGLGLKTD